VGFVKISQRANDTPLLAGRKCEKLHFREVKELAAFWQRALTQTARIHRRRSRWLWCPRWGWNCSGSLWRSEALLAGDTAVQSSVLKHEKKHKLVG